MLRWIRFPVCILVHAGAMVPFMFGSMVASQDCSHIKPNPRIQHQIETFVRLFATSHTSAFGDPRALQELERDRKDILAQIDSVDHVELVRQIVCYRMQNQEMAAGMGSAMIISNLEIGTDVILDALLPFFQVNDVELQQSMDDFIKYTHVGTDGRIDFASYVSYIKASKSNPPEALIEYMFDTSRNKAFRALVELCETDTAHGERVLAVDTAISDIARKRRLRILSRQAAKNSTIRLLESLYNDESPWARLYVAHLIWEEEDCRIPLFIDRLAQDDYPLVREMITRFHQIGENKADRKIDIPRTHVNSVHLRIDDENGQTGKDKSSQSASSEAKEVVATPQKEESAHEDETKSPTQDYDLVLAIFVALAIISLALAVIRRGSS